ncbi:MAG: ABC transporter permease [Candidatus Micrarchaeota archaeon]|nr:ABC transporter permease [Candidatus Micrarchaeota archaeon]
MKSNLGAKPLQQPQHSGSMSDLELAELAMNSLRYRSLRSWLAVLGIVIGVASVISLISISVGMNSQVSSSLSGVGANIITISPGGSRAQGMGFASGGTGGGAPAAFGSSGLGQSSASGVITFEEADALKDVKGVAKVDAQISSRATVAYKNKNVSLTIIGTDPTVFPDSAGSTIIQGRKLGIGDISAAVIGYSVQAESFGNESMLNKQIKIKGSTFRVVGILNKTGSSISGSADRNIYITQKRAKALFNQTDKVSTVIVVAANGSVPDNVAGNITAELLSLHRLTAAKQDFTVITATSMQQAISSVTGTLGLFLGGIASISLIVGGIGVANAMFTSVLEQTRYIGLLKSLGARRRTILKLFLYEAAMVGLVGGLIGLALSFVGSVVLSYFGLPSKITLDLVLLGLGFSVVVGIVSGLLPARNAASVTPVEALRYE